MNGAFTIERVVELPDLSELLAASLAEGHRLIERAITEFNSGANRFDREGEALFIATDGGGRVIGVCGLNIDPFLNNPRIGRVRHLYVLPTHRRQGVARALVSTVIAAARPTFDCLRLRTRVAGADALYRFAGFLPSSADPLATHVLKLADQS